jgi:hypothetical protein
MPDCPASGRSGNGMKENANTQTSPVPALGDPNPVKGMFRYRTEMSDADDISLDADAYLLYDSN